MIECVSEAPNPAGSRLNALLAKASLSPLDPAQSKRFDDYLALLLRWNARVNLTAIRDEEGILSRHFVESIACARALPAGIRTLLDFGSGAGFPGIPIALCRPEIAVTLAESQGKKAAFLSEAIRVLEISAKQAAEERVEAVSKGRIVSGHDFSRAVKAAKSTLALAPEGCISSSLPEPRSISEACIVHSGRAEALRAVFDCVTLRAVDKMELAVQAASKLVRPGGWLALMTTVADLPALQKAAGAELKWNQPLSLPGSEDRVIALGERAIILPA